MLISRTAELTILQTKLNVPHPKESGSFSQGILVVPPSLFLALILWSIAASTPLGS